MESLRIFSTLGVATHTFHSLHRVLWCQKRMKTKLWLFKSVALSTPLYGSETWVPLATHIKHLQSFIGVPASGGQRRRWNDLVMSDLRNCDLLVDWRKTSWERPAW